LDIIEMELVRKIPTGILAVLTRRVAIATLSGAGGATLRTLDIVSGQLLVEKRLHSLDKGAFSEPLHFGKHVTFSPDSSDIYALTNGCTVTSVDGSSGESKWTWTSPDQGYAFLESELLFST
jgi:hypothetical protein